METLEQKLLELKKILPPGNETDDDVLYDIYLLELHEVLGSDSKIWEYDNDISHNLSKPLQDYFYALWYIQSVLGLFSSISGDGMLSVFYNWSGAEIDALKTILKKFNDKLEPLINEAYNLLLPIYKFKFDSNFVTDNPGSNVYDIIPQDIMSQLEDIESKVEKLQDESHDHALSLYKSVSS